MFNLTAININERIQEFALIKAIGFNKAELSMYIFRENRLITFAGIVLGLVCGVFLHGYILQAVEIDMFMFPRLLSPLSFVFSTAIVIVFAMFVDFIMGFKLARIDIIESLKNIE